MKPIIETAAVEGRHIVKNFRLGDTVTEVLRDVSLRVMPGEFVSIMGPSGSGKSTLLYILGGLDTPTDGRVLLNGTDISSFGDEKMSGLRRRNIGFVFQFYNLIPNLNVEENIMLPLLLDGQKMERCKDRLDRILDMVGLSDRRRHTPRELSGGQQQRVAIARALIGNPGILFADEPTGNLDTKAGADIMSLLREINRSTGQTIIMVTHSPEAAKSSSRIITVRDGNFVQDGSRMHDKNLMQSGNLPGTTAI
ncbi:ABC transporter ATP-binding protein [Hungatella hathewayi]|uniref:ABC transporter ATP-binding protein n=1 Tax=Hungatella hathewayi TaxID=154046 RepID=UPI00356ADD55